MWRIAIFWIISLPLPGQTVTDSVADEVCRCMNEIPELIYPKLQARKCLETTADRYADQIKTELGLRVNFSGDLDRLAEILASPLFEDCALLQEMGKGDEEIQLRYSDIPLSDFPERITESKLPPPDPTVTITREVVEQRVFSGTITKVSEIAGLTLRTSDNQSMSFVLTPRQLRQLEDRKGDVISVAYQTDWHSDRTRIIYVLVDVVGR